MTAFSHFDLDHWLKVKAERARQGLVAKTERGAEAVDHFLKGKTVLDTASHRAYIVESVQKDWFQGWFLVALLNHNGSHRICVVDSLTCQAPSIQRAHAQFEEGFKVQQ
jgi:hypothetical protein